MYFVTTTCKITATETHRNGIKFTNESDYINMITNNLFEL